MKRLALLLPLLALAAASARAEDPAMDAPAAGTAPPAYPFAADGSPADVINIRPGDTLSGIAKSIGVPVSRLVEMNDIADPSRIRAGDSLFIPFNSRIPPERRDPADPPANTDASAFSFAKTIGADALHYWEWGAPWNRVEDMELVFAEHRVKIDCYRNGNDYGAKTNATLRRDHVCTDEEWRNILLRLNTARFDNWKESYSSPVCDGTKWRIDFLSGTNIVRSFRGANNWPFLFEQFVEVKKFAMRLPAALATRSPAAEETHAENAEGAEEESHAEGAEGAEAPSPMPNPATIVRYERFSREDGDGETHAVAKADGDGILALLADWKSFEELRPKPRQPGEPCITVQIRHPDLVLSCFRADGSSKSVRFFRIIDGSTKKTRLDIELPDVRWRRVPDEPARAILAKLDAWTAADRAAFLAVPLPRTYVFGTTSWDGGTLSGVARLFYGNGNKWPAIWEANKAAVPDPNHLISGTELVIPALSTRRPAASEPYAESAEGAEN